jgi:hypothetical protein
MATVTALPPEFLAAADLLQAIDLLEPQTWEPADRPPLLPHQEPPPGKWWL